MVCVGLRLMVDESTALRTDYLPRWRALLLARVRFGEDAKLWRDGPRYCVGVVTRRIAPGRTEVRLLGVGANWPEAVRASGQRQGYVLALV